MKDIIHLHHSKKQKPKPTGLQYLTVQNQAQLLVLLNTSLLAVSFTSVPAQGSHWPWEHCFVASRPAPLGAATKDELWTPC